MARPKRTPKKKEPETGLVAALNFIKAAQVDKGNDLLLKSHCRLANGYAVAFDGVLAMGYPIEEEINLCPHTYRLIDALKRCKATLSITQMDNESLVIKSGGYRAAIPCLNPAAIPYAVPDVQAGAIDNRIKDGFALLNPIVSGTGTTTVEASLLLQNNSMVATDRSIMLEYWHGINLPDGLAIPKVAIVAVSKIAVDLVGIGVSDRTVTFYYDNGAWLRTQLYGEKWPDVGAVLNRGDPHKATKVPPALFDAVDATIPFSTSSTVYTSDGCISSHDNVAVGASYELDGVTPGLAFNGKHILAIKNVATTIDLVGDNGVSFFYGNNARGAISQVTRK